MSTPKGYPSQEKDERINSEYVTISKVGEHKYALDVKDQGTVSQYGSDAAEAGTDNMTIVATGHAAKPGDRLRITSGTQIGVEVEVEDTDANTITLQQTLSPALAPGDTFDILRPTSLTVSPTGGIVASSGPTEFIRNGIATQVEEDTVTPANNRPLPVKITGLDGDVSINASNLNLEVQLDHNSANPDSVRIGDGTETVNVNASNEMQVRDDDANTTLTSLDTKTPVYDADTGAGTENVPGVILRKSANGGSVEAGTSSDPLRVDPTGTTAQPVSQATHDNLNLNANIQVGDADVANGNPVPVSDAGGTLTVDQATHDNLNLNANIQVGDADASTANPVPSQISDGVETANVSVNNELQVRDDDAIAALENLQVDTSSAPVDVIDQFDTPLVDATTINGSAGAFVQVVASLAQKCTKIQIMDTGGVHMGIYVGAAASEVLKAQYAPGSDQTLEVEIEAGERISLRSMEVSGPSSGFISMNFIGPDYPIYNDWSIQFTNGSNQRIEIPELAANSPTNAISWTFWVKTNSATAGQAILAHRGVNARFSLFTDNTGGPFEELLIFVSPDGTAGVNAKQWKFSLTPVANNNWNHVVATFEKNLFKVWVNGIFDAGAPDVVNGTVNTLYGGSAGDISIGCQFAGGPAGNFFGTGNIVNVAMYNRALRESEAYEIHNGGKTLDLSRLDSFSNCVGYWKLGNNDTFPTATDSAGISDGNMVNLAATDFDTDVP